MRSGRVLPTVASTTGERPAEDRKEADMRSDRRGRAAIGLIALVLVTAAACGGSGEEPAADPATMVGSKAPELSGQNLAGDGTVDLAEMTGKPTVVAFWLYACPHCKGFIPALQDAWNEAAPDANIVTVGMEYDDPSKIEADPGYGSPQEFIESTGLTLPTVTGTFSAESEAWHLQSTPTVFVIGPDGTITAAFDGEPEPQEILDAVAACAACGTET